MNTDESLIAAVKGPTPLHDTAAVLYRIAICMSMLPDTDNPSEVSDLIRRINNFARELDVAYIRSSAS